MNFILPVVLFILFILLFSLAIVYSRYNWVKQFKTDFSFSWSLSPKMRRVKTRLPWYCQYRNSIRIYDYFSIMICNYPILTFRSWDNPDDDTFISYTLGFLFIFDLNYLIEWKPLHHVSSQGENQPIHYDRDTWHQDEW